VPNGDAALKPGTFARVRIESHKTDQVMTLSYAALQYRYGVNRVFVVNGDHLEARELKVGERFGDRIEIVSGVSGGDSVANADVDRLIDGTKVRVSKNANP
jgi:multidrug efflux pump subunit AcrA (membrane-fusion protein)